MATLNEADKGKHVVDPTGVEIGVITEVHGEVGYLRPDSGLTDRISSVFGLSETEENAYRVDNAAIRAIDETTVWLADEADLKKEQHQ